MFLHIFKTVTIPQPTVRQFTIHPWSKLFSDEGIDLSGMLVPLSGKNNYGGGNKTPSLTCPLPVSDFVLIFVDLPALLNPVSYCQHAPTGHGVCQQQIAALEQRLPEEPHPGQELFTCLGKHVIWATEGFTTLVNKRHTTANVYFWRVFQVIQRLR